MSGRSSRATVSTIAQWRDVRRVYTIYAAIATQFGCGDPPYACLDNLHGQSEIEIIGPIECWLAEMDERVGPHQFRAILERPDVSHSEEMLIALVRRYLQKENSSETDRDKLHYLLTQYAYVCAPPSLRVRPVSLGQIAEVLEPVLGPASGQSIPENLQALTGLVQLMPNCGTFQELQASVVIPGRQMKSGLGNEWASAAALLAVTHFNFSLRCAYGRLLGEEVRASQEGLEQLQSRHVTTVDCTSLGLSSAESVDILRECLAELSAVAPADEGMINARSEQVRALRTTIEATLKGFTTTRTQTEERFAALQAYLERAVNEIGELNSEVQNLRRVIQDMAGMRQNERLAAAQPAAPAPPLPAPPATPKPAPAPKAAEKPEAPKKDYSAEVDRCLSALRHALGANPSPAPLTLRIGAATIALSRGEVQTLRSDDPAALVAQRAIAVRVLLLNALEREKRGEAVEPSNLIEFARATLLALNRLLGTAGTPEFLGVAARQLRTALKSAEVQCGVVHGTEVWQLAD